MTGDIPDDLNNRSSLNHFASNYSEQNDFAAGFGGSPSPRPPSVVGPFPVAFREQQLTDFTPSVERFPVALLLRAHGTANQIRALLEHWIATAGGQGLSCGDWLILLTLCCSGTAERLPGDDDRLSQRELVRRLNISAAQMSTRLERLRERGLVVGVRSPHDRRLQRWKLTDSGWDHTNEWVQRLLHSLDQPEQRSAEQCDERKPDRLPAPELATGLQQLDRLRTIIGDLLDLFTVALQDDRAHSTSAGSDAGGREAA